MGYTALGEQSAENELAMACRCAAKERPNVGDDLLVLLWESFDVLVNENTTARVPTSHTRRMKNQRNEKKRKEKRDCVVRRRTKQRWHRR